MAKDKGSKKESVKGGYNPPPPNQKPPTPTPKPPKKGK